MPTSQPLYAGVYKPSLLRKSILFTVRDALAMLKETSEMTRHSQAKMKALAELRDTMGELRVLTKRLTSLLPTVAHAHMERHVAEVPTITSFSDEEKAPLPRKDHVRSKIEVLESELSRIEEHMKKIKAARV